MDKEAQPLVHRDDVGEGEMREREEMMDLLTLVRRAAVLERMLRAGKRVSIAQASIIE